MDISKNPPSGSSRDSLPIIHRRRISDKELEQLVLGQIQQQPDFTLFTHLQSPQHRTHGRNHSYREVLEHDENRRVLLSRPEFSGEMFDRYLGQTFKVAYSSTEVKVLSIGKPISEFVPYYVWHEDSGVHCYNLTTGKKDSVLFMIKRWMEKLSLQKQMPQEYNHFTLSVLIH